jgi:hypothetical protein
VFLVRRGLSGEDNISSSGKEGTEFTEQREIGALRAVFD